MIPGFRALSRAAAPLALAALVAACGGGSGGGGYDLTILHVNDHHSRLDPETVNLRVLTAGGARESVTFEFGGAARVVQAIDELAATGGNVLKLHAGDAITGDLYYTITDGAADAAMMNAVCYDAFAIGNHEFDSGDAGLKRFLDFLRAGSCMTPALTANVFPKVGVSPLAASSPTDYLRPSTIVERGGERIGIVGLTIAGKTRDSSRPDPTTEFRDEVASAQAAIDDLVRQGVNKIVLLSHQGYATDVAMAKELSQVDVIVGGDSHTLLGPSGLSTYGITPGGAYPTQALDRNGFPVCVAQAWQYNHAVGELKVRFNSLGLVETCGGRPYVMIGNALRRSASGAAALSDADKAAIAADLATQPSLRPTALSARAVAALAPFAAERAAFASEVVGQATENLCLRRVPGTKRDVTRSSLGDECNKGAFTDAHGGDTQQLVALAFLEQGKAFGGADIAIQNAGGVRIDIPLGTITVGTVYTLLPFRNVLVRLTMTGAELRQSLEDAVTFVLAASGNTGAFPYAANLRWTVDLNRPANDRFSALEVKDANGNWVPLDANASYRVMTNDFIAAGQDGYKTLATITGARREDQLFLDYADSFLRYVLSVGTVARLPQADYSTQVFVDTP